MDETITLVQVYPFASVLSTVDWPALERESKISDIAQNLIKKKLLKQASLKL